MLVQVVEFAMSVLGDLREDDSLPMVTRSGPPVELFRFTDHGACVAFLADALSGLLRDEPFASVAVLTPALICQRCITTVSSEVRFETPQGHQQNFSFSPGVEITEVDQVKGLEFDYIVLVEVSANAYPDNPLARRLLHGSYTRRSPTLVNCCRCALRCSRMRWRSTTKSCFVDCSLRLGIRHTQSDSGTIYRNPLQ